MDANHSAGIRETDDEELPQISIKRKAGCMKSAIFYISPDFNECEVGFDEFFANNEQQQPHPPSRPFASIRG